MGKKRTTIQTILIVGGVAMGFVSVMTGCGIIAKVKPSSAAQSGMGTPNSSDKAAVASETPAEASAATAATHTGVVSPEPTDSLWRADSALGSLFVSQKAHHVGDIVTIRIVESSSATNQATTATGRNSSIAIETPKFFGAESEVPEGWLFNPLGELSAGFGSDFEGDGATKRSGDLTAYITAKITEVFPNGNLRIMGTREVAINNETQFIHLSGIIRSRDISTDNVILSTYIADAKIEYSGDGVVDDRQKPGWLTSFLNKIWPF